MREGALLSNGAEAEARRDPDRLAEKVCEVFPSERTRAKLRPAGCLAPKEKASARRPR